MSREAAAAEAAALAAARAAAAEEASATAAAVSALGTAEAAATAEALVATAVESDAALAAAQEAAARAARGKRGRSAEAELELASATAAAEQAASVAAALSVAGGASAAAAAAQAEAQAAAEAAALVAAGGVPAALDAKRVAGRPVVRDEGGELMEGVEGQEFEDPYADDVEEEVVEYPGGLAAAHAELEEQQRLAAARAAHVAAGGVDSDGDVEFDDRMPVPGDDDDDDDDDDESGGVFRPGVDQLAEGEVLDYDADAYQMLHRMNVEWPCLSFDIHPDLLGASRTSYPMTAYVVAGTQAAEASSNKIMMMKLSQLHRTKHDDEEDGTVNLDLTEEEGGDLDDEPELDLRSVPHPGAVNRLRVSPHAGHLVATWSDEKRVLLWDLSRHMAALDAPPATRLPTSVAPVADLSRHTDEGFALAWSPHTSGRLVSGDCAGGLYLSELQDGVAWVQHERRFRGHDASVEDLAWSVKEGHIFASCSVDGTVKVWDVRQRRFGLSFVASEVDVNVISWNLHCDYLLASGHDDGAFAVWDMRSLKKQATGAPPPNRTKAKRGNVPCTRAQYFKWHSDQVTSIAWDPNDESVIAVAGADDQVAIWDLSVEADVDEAAAASAAAGGAAGAGADDSSVPPQLMFVHQGQTSIKEVRWHPQIPNLVMSTALDSFNVFVPDVTVAQEEVGKEEVA